MVSTVLVMENVMRRTIQKWMIIGAVCGILPAACAKNKATTQDDSAVVDAQTSQLQSGLDLKSIDNQVRPQDDFYRYVNGVWLATTKLPSDRSNYGSFTEVSDVTDVQLRQIVDEISKDESVKAGSSEQKIRDFYNAYIEASTRDSVDISSLKQHELAKVDAINSLEDFYKVSGELRSISISLGVSVQIRTDFKDPNSMEVYISQPRLTLPDRDYYLEQEERYVEGRKLMVDYISTMMGFAGYKADNASKILELETKFAEISWAKEQLRKPELQYNPKTLEELEAFSPGVAWKTILESAGFPERERYIVRQDSYVEKVDDILTSTDVDVLKDYARFKVLSRYGSVLGKPGFDAGFAFSSKGLSGVEEPRPDWKRAIAELNWMMGEVLGQVYVKRHFKPEAKERMVKLVDNLLEAYRGSIKQLDWMGEETRVEALKKVDSFRPKIGYPDKWTDFSSVEITTDAVANRRALYEFDFQRDLEKLGKSVDKSEWYMSPQRVNAYYNPAWNEIVFPAAILQPPFFDLSADDAVNYGGIGAVIGHEIGHGFDDSGRKFDSTGAMRDWWTEEDAAAFEAKKEALKAQYEAFEVINGKTINGEFTSGENIGDLAGLSIAYKAYRASLDGKEAPVINGFTGDQRFFMGWAQVWRRLYTDQELEKRLVTDPHSPGVARTNVIVRNIPAFYEAFDVKPGDGMYLPPEQRVTVW